MSGLIEGQTDLNIALRRTCNIDADYPCTYYYATQHKYLTTGTDCKSTCCYPCHAEKRIRADGPVMPAEAYENGWRQAREAG